MATCTQLICVPVARLCQLPDCGRCHIPARVPLETRFEGWNVFYAEFWLLLEFVWHVRLHVGLFELVNELLSWINSLPYLNELRF